MGISTKHQKHLINILRTNRLTSSNKNQPPTFTLFLGAGSSITSGIKSARQMIEEWRNTYAEIHGQDKLQYQHWYNKQNEYSELFESLYDQPSQRREYIESCVSEAQVSWGYIYLVNLLNKNFFNTVFTTNFDDLLNEACYLFSENLRPIVSAHDSSIQSIRLTSPRPKIIKLHGDFLFDNIKNTVRELESLEDNTRAKFRQYANEFGMIFIGYAGNDRSIMDTLNTLLNNRNNFPHGVYWCVLKGTNTDSLPIEVQNLARFDRFHLIEIDGFDEFFAELHSVLGYSLQEQVTSPSIALQTKLDRIIFKYDCDNSDSSSSCVECTDAEDSDGSEDYEESEGSEILSDGAKIIRRDNLTLSQHFYNLSYANNLLLSLSQKIKKIKQDKGDKVDEDCCNNQEIEVIIDQLSECLEFVIVDAENDSTYIPIAVPKTIRCFAHFSDNDFDSALQDGLAALKISNSSEVLNVVIRSIAKTKASKEIPAIRAFIGSDSKTRTRRDIIDIMNAIVDLISEEMFLSARQLLSALLPHAKLLDLNLPESKVTLSYLKLNQALCVRLGGYDINGQFHQELSKDLEYSITSNNKRLMFGLACILNMDDIAISALNLMSLAEIERSEFNCQPIYKIMSSEVKDAIIAIYDDKKQQKTNEQNNNSIDDKPDSVLTDSSAEENDPLSMDDADDNGDQYLEGSDESNVVNIQGR